jgi:hypothetical protein
MGAYHFPQDAAITELEASAKKGAGANLLPAPFRAVAGLIGALTDAGRLVLQPM